LQFSGGHQAAGYGQSAQDDFARQDRHFEGGNAIAVDAEEVLGGADKRDAECAESVAESGPLGNGGHLDEAERDPNGSANAQSDENPGVIDRDVLEPAFTAKLEDGASDGEDHADFARQDTATSGRRRDHPFEGQDEERARYEIDEPNKYLTA